MAAAGSVKLERILPITLFGAARSRRLPESCLRRRMPGSGATGFTQVVQALLERFSSTGTETSSAPAGEAASGSET